MKGINQMRRKQKEEPKAAPAPTAQELLLGEIRDLLKAQKANPKEPAVGA